MIDCACVNLNLHNSDVNLMLIYNFFTAISDYVKVLVHLKKVSHKNLPGRHKVTHLHLWGPTFDIIKLKSPDLAYIEFIST